LYAANRPELIALSLGIQVVIVMLVGLALVPGWGPLGMAIAILASRLFSLLFVSVGSYRMIEQKLKVEAHVSS
jgi:O-antigen/teichoic acid export membrane protein